MTHFLSFQGRQVLERPITSTFYQPFDLYEQGKFDQLLEGMITAHAQNEDTSISDAMTNKLFMEDKTGNRKTHGLQISESAILNMDAFFKLFQIPSFHIQAWVWTWLRRSSSTVATTASLTTTAGGTSVACPEPSPSLSSTTSCPRRISRRCRLCTSE